MKFCSVTKNKYLKISKIQRYFEISTKLIWQWRQSLQLNLHGDHILKSAFNRSMTTQKVRCFSDGGMPMIRQLLMIRHGSICPIYPPLVMAWMGKVVLMKKFVLDICTFSNGSNYKFVSWKITIPLVVLDCHKWALARCQKQRCLLSIADKLLLLPRLWTTLFVKCEITF